MSQSAEKLSAEIKKTANLNYLQYLPDDYGTTDKKYPLIIFLHGAGERGNDINMVKKHGIPKLIEENASVIREYEFIAVSPQCPEGMWWNVLYDEIDTLIQTCVENLQVDKSRIYLTGLSMGGYGTWYFALKHPRAFAAIAPICGGAEACGRLSIIKNVPIWAFHGEKDDVVPFSQSAEVVDKLKELGANVKFTAYPELFHDSWTVTYNNPDFYKWLFAQKNKKFQF